MGIITSIFHISSPNGLSTSKMLPTPLNNSYYHSGTASLTSSLSSLTGSLCPQVVAMTCSVGNIQHLRWFTSSFNTNTYVFSPGDESRVPIDIEASPPLPTGVMIAVVSVSQSTGDPDRFTAVSTLNTTLSVFRDLDTSSVHCGSSSNEVQSETIRVEFTILG